MNDAELEIPETPGDVPYRDREDAWAQRLLTANGRPDDDASVEALLDSPSELL